MWPNPQFPLDSVTFTEEIHNGKFHFLCSDLSKTFLVIYKIKLVFYREKRRLVFNRFSIWLIFSTKQFLILKELIFPVSHIHAKSKSIFFLSESSVFPEASKWKTDDRDIMEDKDIDVKIFYMFQALLINSYANCCWFMCLHYVCKTYICFKNIS